MLLIHNSSPLSCRSVINGATISISASARFIGPLVWAILCLGPSKNDVAWVSWWSLSLFCMVALYQSYKIAPIDDNENVLHGQGSEDTYNSQSQFSDLRMAHRSSLSSLSNQRYTT
ncbi:AMH_1a_G0005710.mRNA.1.CDS.1 [Saccharomyces cerevisiae]|nr:EM14S01-3B_G0050890.mRNA.1.CDS.1 [Saccharomyces cerevisiae]CAI4296419.1 AMH_1a_G0005710.mRNA.1.CDS.1 [Saccharomyces cerevisiae]CAI6518580.1 AMH_1a_G0005710.mRNA.1.CDS.1 [Saccharomyces cerevisiae]